MSVWLQQLSSRCCWTIPFLQMTNHHQLNVLRFWNKPCVLLILVFSHLFSWLTAPWVPKPWIYDSSFSHTIKSLSLWLIKSRLSWTWYGFFVHRKSIKVSDICNLKAVQHVITRGNSDPLKLLIQWLCLISDDLLLKFLVDGLLSNLLRR